MRLRHRGARMAAVLVTAAIFFEASAFAWKLAPEVIEAGLVAEGVDIQDVRRRIWRITEAWRIGLTSLLVAWLVPVRLTLAKICAVVLIGFSGVWHIAEVTGCNVARMATGPALTTGRSVCEIVVGADYVTVYLLTLLAYVGWLTRRALLKHRSVPLDDRGDFALYLRPRRLQEIAAAVFSYPHGAKSRVIAGRWFHFRRGRLIESDPPEPAAFERYIVLRISERGDPSALRGKVGTRWRPWRNCWTVL